MPIISGSGSSSAASGTVGGLVEETRRWLHGSIKSEMDVLNGSIASATASVTVTDAAGGIVPGAYLAIDDEVVYVRSVSGSVATVLRGQLGTTKASHATDTVVEVQPRFPKPFIKDALRAEIRSWGQRLFATQTVEATASSSYRSQALDIAAPAGWYRILEVLHAPDSNRTSYSKVWERVYKWRMVRDADPGDFATNNVAIIIQENIPSVDIRVTFAKPFALGVFEDATDLGGDIGLDEGMFDIPAVGAAWRLLATQEAPRTDTRAQGISKRAEQVPPGHSSGASQGLKRIRDERLQEEHERLLARWATLQR